MIEQIIGVLRGLSDNAKRLFYTALIKLSRAKLSARAQQGGLIGATSCCYYYGFPEVLLGVKIGSTILAVFLSYVLAVAALVLCVGAVSFVAAAALAQQQDVFKGEEHE